jgi:hypothetical protein
LNDRERVFVNLFNLAEFFRAHVAGTTFPEEAFLKRLPLGQA